MLILARDLLLLFRLHQRFPIASFKYVERDDFQKYSNKNRAESVASMPSGVSIITCRLIVRTSLTGGVQLPFTYIGVVRTKVYTVTNLT